MVKLALKKGDEILTGKFKNKKEKVKNFGTDKNGQPTINGRKMLTFRIVKMWKTEEVDLDLEQIEEDIFGNNTERIVITKMKQLLKYKNEINKYIKKHSTGKHKGKVLGLIDWALWNSVDLEFNYDEIKQAANKL